MNLPAKDILIDNIVFSVEICDSDTMGMDGRMVGRTNRLLLKADQTPGDFLDTFAHEVLHAIVRTRCPTVMTNDVEETVVQAMAPGLIQVLRENPDWLVWVIGLCRSSGTRQRITRPTSAANRPAAETPPRPAAANPEKENPNDRTSERPCKDVGTPSGAPKRGSGVGWPDGG